MARVALVTNGRQVAGSVVRPCARGDSATSPTGVCENAYRKKLNLMAKKANKPDPAIQAWIDARRRHHLSHTHVQMARELGMNPKKFGKIDNHKQEPWKAPLPIFIEDLYFKRFRKDRPDRILPMEELFRLKEAKKEAKHKARHERKAVAATPTAATPTAATPNEISPRCADRSDQ